MRQLELAEALEYGNQGPDKKPTTTEMVETLKQENQDFEWYPTTPEIIDVIKSRIGNNDSVLDVGAGDGRVLTELTDGDKYAIEKATPLIQAMPADIYIIGTDFFQSTLIDKKVDAVFCNPPYSEFEAWARKIILEANTEKVFLVMPTRWKDSPGIQAAIKKREAASKSIGGFNFTKAERAARAEVDVVYIDLTRSRRFKNNHYHSEPINPFYVWFDEEFKFQEANDKPRASNTGSTLRAKLEKAIIGGRGKVPMLVQLYNHEMRHLYDNFKKIAALDADVLNELGVTKGTVQKALEKRITGLKYRYWKELFNNLDDITDRLTTGSRKKMLDKLTAQTNVDFTESNIYAVLIWVIKNANKYYDQQLIETVQEMISDANVFMYKSNQKTFVYDRWRYGREKTTSTHYGLELRIVLHRWSAIQTEEHKYRTYDYPNKLHQSAHDFINDLLTIANNLNFKTWPHFSSLSVGEWESNKNKEFFDIDGKNLMWVKAFMNGNLHIKFNQKFIRRLNVEFGRLKGWLKDAHQAAQELNIPEKEIEDITEAFGCNRQITASNVKLLENRKGE